MIFVAAICLLLAGIPCILFFQNLRLYKTPLLPENSEQSKAAVSVLIPARDEAINIVGAIQSVQQNIDMKWELLVLDDHSQDATAEIVQRLGAMDARIRLLSAPPLPDGWNGKQHACHILAKHARYPILVFMDADVRLAPGGLRRIGHFLQANKVALGSGVPCQTTGSFWEHLLVPLIHFVLLGFLPLRRMRGSTDPSYGAGCGQLFVASAEAYQKVGGHAVIHNSRHDGVQLPRAFRRVGFRTDLFDATHIASCRMYHNASEVWHGFIKNAHEGLAAVPVIFPVTIILLCGQVAPWLLLLNRKASRWVLMLAGLSIIASGLPRLVAAVRFKQSKLGALLHPFGILALLLIQWASFVRRLRGQSTPWKGRVDLQDVPHQPIQRTS